MSSSYNAMEQSPKSLRVGVHALKFPGGDSPCPYLSYEEFSNCFTTELIQSLSTFGLTGVLQDQGDTTEHFEAEIASELIQLNPYRTLSRLFILPFATFKKYVRANFVVRGTIRLRYRTTIPFVLNREFEKGRLGEKTNMLVGIRSEAMHVASMTAAALAPQSANAKDKPFWQYVTLAPLVTGLIAFLAVMALGHLWLLNAVPSRDPQDDKLPIVFLGQFAFILVAMLTLAFAPNWIYTDPRAGFAYRMISTTRSFVLRIFIVVAAFPLAFVISLFMLLFSQWLRGRL